MIKLTNKCQIKFFILIIDDSEIQYITVRNLIDNIIL